MAENEKKPTAEVNQSVKVTISKKRSLTRKQSTDRNYPKLQSGKEIFKRNFNGFTQMIIRNYRKLGN